jgi:hypothetical protein
MLVPVGVPGLLAVLPRLPPPQAAMRGLGSIMSSTDSNNFATGTIDTAARKGVQTGSIIVDRKRKVNLNVPHERQCASEQKSVRVPSISTLKMPLPIY